jgi:hypothetical protein
MILFIPVGYSKILVINKNYITINNNKESKKQ